MKQIKHEERKSFRKWGMEGQRTETVVKEFINDRRVLRQVQGRRGWENIGKNNGPLKHSVPAQNISRQFTLQKHSIVNDPCGPKARSIASYNYERYLQMTPEQRENTVFS